MRPTQIARAELDPTGVSPLGELEQTLLAALDDLLVSTTVVRERARLLAGETKPLLLKTSLSRIRPIATILAACGELERRGLAERVEAAGATRWRRTGVSTLT